MKYSSFSDISRLCIKALLENVRQYSVDVIKVIKAILKKLSVGGNPPGCNLEASKKVFLVFPNI